MSGRVGGPKGGNKRNGRTTHPAKEHRRRRALERAIASFNGSKGSFARLKECARLGKDVPDEKVLDEAKRKFHNAVLAHVEQARAEYMAAEEEAAA